jgi:hypothetical protein
MIGAAAMQRIAEWLEKLGMSEYAERFAENDIDFTILGDLTDQDLEKIGVGSLGHRRKLLRRRYWTNVAWLVAPPPPGTSVHIHHWAGQHRVLSTDGTPLGTVQAALTGLLRAQVAQDVGRIDITYLGPADLSGA